MPRPPARVHSASSPETPSRPTPTPRPASAHCLCPLSVHLRAAPAAKHLRRDPVSSPFLRTPRLSPVSVSPRGRLAHPWRRTSISRLRSAPGSTPSTTGRRGIELRRGRPAHPSPRTVCISQRAYHSYPFGGVLRPKHEICIAFPSEDPVREEFGGVISPAQGAGSPAELRRNARKAASYLL